MLCSLDEVLRQNAAELARQGLLVLIIIANSTRLYGARCHVRRQNGMQSVLVGDCEKSAYSSYERNNIEHGLT